MSSKEVFNAYNKEWTVAKKVRHEQGLGQLKNTFYKGKPHGFGENKTVIMRRLEKKVFKPSTTKYV